MEKVRDDIKQLEDILQDELEQAYVANEFNDALSRESVPEPKRLEASIRERVAGENSKVLLQLSKGTLKFSVAYPKAWSRFASSVSEYIFVSVSAGSQQEIDDIHQEIYSVFGEAIYNAPESELVKFMRETLDMLQYDVKTKELMNKYEEMNDPISSILNTISGLTK